jgi:hypothetical protein
MILLNNSPVRVPLLEAKHKLVYVLSASVTVPFILAIIRTLAKLIKALTTQSTIDPNGT